MWPLRTVVQTCVHPPAAQHLPVRLPQGTGRRWPATCDRSTPPPSKPAARERFEEFADKWGAQYPAIIAAVEATPGRSSCRSWTTTWRSAASSAPRTPSESINARYRRAVRARGHFPTEQAALKCLYLVTRSLDPTGKGRARWVDQVETGAQRIRDHLRRPPSTRARPNHAKAESTVYRTLPSPANEAWNLSLSRKRKPSSGGRIGGTGAPGGRIGGTGAPGGGSAIRVFTDSPIIRG